MLILIKNKKTSQVKKQSLSVRKTKLNLVKEVFLSVSKQQYKKQ